jgi:hypothetical protein
VGVAFVGVVAGGWVATVAAEFLGAGMPFDLFFRFPVWLAARAGAAGAGVMVLGAAGAGAAAFGAAAGLPKNLLSSLNMASWGADLLDVE